MELQKPLPKITAKARARLRRAKTLAETSHGIGGVKKSGHFAPKPITLRLPPERR